MKLLMGEGTVAQKICHFFEHYYGGGVRSIRGFDDNTIGPRDSKRKGFWWYN